MKKFTSLVLALASFAIPVFPLSARLEVASLSSVLADIANQVGGDAVTVTNIIKPGVDPHVFDPTVRDVKTMSQAKVVLASGLGFEPYLTKLKGSLGTGPKLVVVGESIKPIMIEEDHTGHDHDHGHSHGATDEHGKLADPHWWHSVSNVKIATNVIRDAFIAADPENKAAYSANAKSYQANLDALAKWIKLEVAKLPRDKRVLVTSHDALGYLANDYGFEIYPVQGISTKEQPSSQKVRGLIDEIKKQQVKAIFAENIENPKILSEITRETGANLGGSLYADGLGASEANTYDRMMRHNVTTIVSALQ